MSSEDTDTLVLLGYDQVRQFAFAVEAELAAFVATADLNLGECNKTFALVFPPLRTRYADILLRISEWFFLQVENYGWGDERCLVVIYDPNTSKCPLPHSLRNRLKLSDFFPHDQSAILHSKSSVTTPINSSSPLLRRHGRGCFTYTPSWLESKNRTSTEGKLDQQSNGINSVSKASNIVESSISRPSQSLSEQPPNAVSLFGHPPFCSLDNPVVCPSDYHVVFGNRAPLTTHVPNTLDAVIRQTESLTDGEDSEKSNMGGVQSGNGSTKNKIRDESTDDISRGEERKGEGAKFDYSEGIASAMRDVEEHLNGVCIISLQRNFNKYVKTPNGSTNNDDKRPSRRTFVRHTPGKNCQSQHTCWDTASDWQFDDEIFLHPFLSNGVLSGLRFQVEGTGTFGILFSTADLTESTYTRPQTSWNVDFVIQWSSVDLPTDEDSRKRWRRRSSSTHDPTDRSWLIRVVHQGSGSADSSDSIAKVPFRNPSSPISNFWVSIRRRPVEVPLGVFGGREILAETTVTVGQGEFPRDRVLVAKWTAAVDMQKIEKYINSGRAKLIQNVAERPKIYFSFGWGSVLSHLIPNNSQFILSQQEDFRIRSVFKLERLCDRERLPRRDHILQLGLSGWPSSDRVPSGQMLDEGNGRTRRSGVGSFSANFEGSWAESIASSISSLCNPRPDQLEWASNLCNQFASLGSHPIPEQSVISAVSTVIRRVVPLSEDPKSAEFAPNSECYVRDGLNGGFLIVTSSVRAATWLVIFLRLSVMCAYLRCKGDSALLQHARQYGRDETNHSKSADDSEFKLPKIQISVSAFLNIFDIETERELSLLSFNEVSHLFRSLFHEKILKSIRANSENTESVNPTHQYHPVSILARELQNILPSHVKVNKSESSSSLLTDRIMNKDTTVTSLGLIPMPEDSIETRQLWVCILSQFTLEARQALLLWHRLEDSQRTLMRQKDEKPKIDSTAHRLILRALQTRPK